MERTLLIMGLSFWSLTLTTLETVSTKLSNWLSDKESIENVENNYSSTYSESLAPDCSNTIAGYVFRDDNFNGINDGESGVENVTVNAYDSGGTLVGFGTSDAAGEYQIASTNVGTEYRIEFELPTSVSDWATPTVYGTDNGSMIQFAQPGSCVNLGLVGIDDVCLPYAQVSTNLGTPFPDGKLLGAGAAFVSCGSIEDMPASSRYVVGVMDFRTINYTNNRSEQVPAMFHHKSWVVDSMGTIFGTDVDDNGNMYAAASSHYGAGFGWGGGGANYSNAVLNFGGIGGGDNATSAGTIYKLDAITGKAKVFVQLPQQSFTYTAIACEDGITKTRSNVGVGLGNVEYDEVHDQFFASNFEDGKIYRIDKSGAILNSFDPQTLAGFAADNGTPGWAADAKPYGLAVEPNGNRLFFGTHEKDESPGLYSVDLDASGNFTSTETKHSDITGEGILGFHYAIKPGWIAVSDLEFSPDGDLMVGTRTGCANNYASSHNHGAGYKIYADSDSNGLFDNLTTSPDIQYNNDATGNDDGYGGIGIWNKHDDTWQFAVSSSDIVSEPGPHGILLFPHDWANSGNGSSSYALQPSAAVPYIPSLNINDFKGIGGDVTSYSPCHYNPIEIGQLLWEDTNKNGIQDAGEEGIANVTLRLFDKYCTPVGVTQTSASGEYFFNSSNVDTLGVAIDGTAPVSGTYTGLAPNTTYYIALGASGDWNASNDEITIGAKDYELTLKGQGSKTSIDNNIEETTVCGELTDVPVITVNTDDFGYVDHSFDIGLKFCPKLLGIDVQQSGAIVTSICKGEALDLKLSHTLETGDVAIYTGPSGLTAAQLYDFANHSTNSISSVYASISPLVTNTMTLQTGLVPSLSSVTYYFIFADGNTNIESSCQPMQSVTVIVNPPTPAATLDVGPHDLCSENSPYVAGDENVIDLNGYVTSGYQGGTWSTTNTIAAANLDGSTFTAVKVLAGETINFRYTVPGAMPASGTSCDDNIYTIEIEVKECYATLGNIVWEDKNGNGVQDDGATGIPGVTVELYECPGGVKGAKLETKATNSNGNYLFDKLPDGEYCVKFDLSTSTLPEVNDLKFTVQNSTADSGDDTNDSDASPIDGCSSSYTLVAEDEELTVDAGVYIPSKLGDYVWEDKNYNGVQDSNEPGIENVTVTLSGTDGLGNTITAQTTQTDNTGMYMFGDLEPGKYNVTFSQPTGYGPTADNDPANNGNDELDSDADPDMSLITPTIPVESGDTIPNVDAGFIVLSKLGDLVWEDTNGNGVQDTDEPGIQFVDVTLTGTDGLGTTVTPQTVTTDANGMYMFGDLYPGDYVVTFEQPDGYEPTQKDDPSQFGNENSDSDADPTDNLKSDVTTIISGDTIPNVDAGFVVLSKLGDLVWEDDNYNGVQDANEPGIENATVTLTGTDGFGNPITAQTIQTDNTGMYMFGDLWPGTYVVTFSQPTDMVPTTLDDPNNNGDDEEDSDADPNDGLKSPQTVIFSGDTIPNVDAGFVDLVQLGNLVWEDINYNGVQDNGEPGIENVTVILNGTDGMGNVIDPQVLQTNGNGEYCFTNLFPGDYNVTFTQPAGYVPTVLDDPKTNGDDTDDSDANPIDNLETIVHTLTSGDDNKTLDAGFVILSKLGDVVWEDMNYNGVQDINEPGIENVTVTLNGVNGLGDVIPTQTITTDGNGMYMFGDLYPGNYNLKFTQPDGYVPTTLDDPKSNGDDTDDSDADPNDNLETTDYLVESGDTIPTIDAGFVILSKLGDLVWEDVNYNGVQDATEPGIGNVIVTLTGTNGLGEAIATQVIMTDGTGMYMFGDLYPGDYTLKFEQPKGYVPTVLDDPKSNGDDADDSDANPTDNLETTVYPVVSGDTIPTIDAGFLVLSKLGDLVWEDMNGNAIQAATEPGIENVTVTLTGTNGLGNAITPIVVQTDETGMYMFGDIYPGNYEVTFEQPTGFVPTKFDDPSNFGDDENDSDADETDNLTSPVTLIQSGDTIPNVDAGFLILSELGDKVWEDLNGNGIQNSGEPGIPNSTVTLTGTNGLGNPITPIILQTTPNGMYNFEDLWPGDYTVTFENPTGFVPTENDDPKGFGNDNNDSDADTNDNLESPVTTLESGDDVNNVDAGFLILSKIGDVVWEDIDGNAVQNNNEPGIENVIVTLTGNDGFGDPVGPTALQTDANGMYMFSDLWPGEYVVTFSQPTGYVPTPKDDPNTNGDDQTDSDADPNDNLQSPETTIVSGDTIPNIDGGFLVLAEIGDFAWQDYDADGVQDPNEDPFENIDLTLTGNDNMNNPVNLTTTTDENGNYDFGDLWPGTYIVTCGLPTDLVQTIYEEPTSVEENDSDFDLVTNQTTPISVVSKDTFHYLDAGFYGEDFGDAPNTFETTKAQDGPIHVIQPGKYLGTSVDAELNGKPQATSGYTGVGGDDNDPSNYEKGTNPTGDENGLNFITPMIPGHEACVEVTTTALSGNNYLTAWIDFSGNGNFESNEQLIWKNGGSTTTDLLVANGVTTANYCFDVPVDATFDGGETHSRFRLSCETGVQPTGRVIGGEVEDYYEAFAKIGNLVWRDYEFEGDQDEPTYDGFNGVEVQLVWEGLDGILGNADDVTYSTTTSEIDGENGKYCFFGAVPGDYTVKIPTIPAGFEPTQSDMTGDENTDSDGVAVDFTIDENFNLPEGENGMTDNPTGHNYPDKQDNLQFDFGFIAFDYGDLPAGFPTKDADAETGAHHSIIPCMYLGEGVDSEQDGAYQDEAGTDGLGGDDNTTSPFTEGTLSGNSDEDGIEFITPLVPGAEAKIKVTAKAPAGGAVLNAWIDFNGDGDFINDPTEQVVFTKTSTSVINSQDAAIEESAAPVDYIFCFEVPADATFDGGETHVRFRLSKDGADYDGFAVGGEVEDYWIPFAKVGNYVWYDANHNGLQDEPTVEGHDGVTITLTWAGFDETIGTADDSQYTTISATDENGVKGKYCFLGLQGGETYTLQATVPDGFVTTKETTTGVADNDSNTPVIEFTLPDDVSNLPVGENGTEDHPGGSHGYADNQDNLEFDFGIVAFDFGDLPDDFKSTTSKGGAYHVINKGMYLGTCVDSDYDAVTNAEAGFDNIGGDDEAGSAYFEGSSTADDEDGFRLVSPMIPGKEACVEITSTMPVGTDGIVNIFIDFNGDGDFENDPNESVYFTKVNNNPMGANTNGTVAAGENVLTKFSFTVPAEATFEGGETHVRVRLSPAGFLSYDGEGIGGEVEDYYIPMAKVGSLAWLDYNDDGIQNEPDYAGYNGLKIELTAPGSDATLGTADDVIYDTYTADNALGQRGTWEFCGLPEGDYQVEIDPAGLFPAKEGIGSEDKDSDPLIVPFTIGHTADGLLLSENGMNEDPNGTSFPDERNLLSIDFGFLAFDFGDIPDGFETFLENNGARHIVKSELYMGTSVDIESDAHTDFAGGEGRSTSGDNMDPGLRTVGQKDPIKGDEDGIRLRTPMIPGDTALLEIRYNSPDAPAYLNAFIDFGGNEKFAKDDNDAVRFVYDPLAHARSANQGTLLMGRGAVEITTNPQLPQGHDVTCLIPFLVPEDATFHGGDVHLRFRLSTEGDLDYNGLALDGEVEDYWFPVACAGNWVWYDFDKEGDQNETADYGMNNFKMYLQTPGLDGVYGTDDDFKYYQNTTTKDGIDGRFDFCGLIEGTYRVGYDEYPDYMIPAIPEHVSDDEMDSGGLMDEFEVSRFADNAPTNEHGMADNMPDPNEFPDNQVTSNLDFGFIMDPVLGGALAIQGVDFAESNTCGHFNATYDMCIEAFEVTDVNNLRVTLDFDEANRLGDAFINLVKVPEVIESTATTLPTLNSNYDGANDVEMFDGVSGLMEKGQKICYRFTIEIDPEAIPNALLAQAALEGGAVNDSGVEVPDLINGGQSKEYDLSDSGLDPSTTNESFEGNTGGSDDPTPVTDCWESSTPPVCNNHVTISLDGDGKAIILGDHLNEALNAPCDDGTLPLGGYYQIQVTDLSGRMIGNTVDCSHIGQTLVAKSTHVASCNSCWGTITIEDKFAPEITCGRDTVVECTADLDFIGGVTVIDNCDADPTIRLVHEDKQLDECNEMILVRSYQATDEYGNQSAVCEQTIRVIPTALTFPEDTTWTCEEYALYPNISNPTELDDDIELTGSGVLSVMNVDNAVCKYQVDYRDEILEACADVSLDVSFKILRTWTVLNWCTGEVTNHVQLIKVADKEAPVITFGSDFSNEILVNQSVQGLHGVCSSSGVIDVPEITDNCAGIEDVQLETPAGPGTPVFDNDGNVTGFTVSAPYLDAGSHEVTYIVTDKCGNRTAATAQINVVDDTPPVAVCNEVTKVSLNNAENGIASVEAIDFDGGSYDNCGPVYFKIRKMETGTCDDANIDKQNELEYTLPNGTPRPQEWFDDEVKFCCTEIGTTVNVILRVYDVAPPMGAVPTDENTLLHKDDELNDRFNDCMVEVLIEDKSRPSCIAPDDLWLTCSEVPDNIDWEDVNLLNDLYGEASGYDNCSFETEAVSTNVNLNQCGVGTVTRSFRTTDDSNNRNVNSCRQTIMIQPVTDYCVTFPADFEGECNGSYAPADLTFVENGCDLIAVNKERTEFFAGTNGGECKKEFFTWTVINWCEYDGISGPVKLDRDADGNRRIDSGTYCSTGDKLVFADDDQISYPSIGFYTWEQHVKIFDNTAPVVTFDGDVTFGGGDLDEDPCTGSVEISISVDESCTAELTSQWQISAFSDRFVNPDFSGGGTTINGRYPLGTHTARFIVTDDCGNTSWKDVTFEIIDAKAPTPACFNGLSVQLMPTGMVEIWAKDLDASSFDYCHDIKITANVVEDRIRDGFINSADYLTTPPTDENILLTCDHVGLATVQMWVTELSDDGVNQSEFCVTFVEVQDFHNACDVSKLVSIGGNIQNEEGESVENVKVNLSGDTDLSQTTKDDGKFKIANLLEGGDYTIAPTRNDDIRNGVSTFDLALISKHILNVRRLDSPYKMIAADANRSGSVTTLDLVAIRKVILYVTNEFPNNSSWRFIDKDFQFDNSNNPFAQFFPEAKSFNNLSIDETANFIGVKVGDVNGDAQPNSLSYIEDRSFNDNFLFKVEDQEFEAGETIEVLFSSDELEQMMGYQFTLNFDMKVLELVEIQDQSATQQNFGQTRVGEGILTCSWNDEKVKDEKAFKLIFETKAAGKISEMIAVNSEYTTAEAYTKRGEFKNVGIDFGNKAQINGFVLYQNQPNPFFDETTLGFELPEQSEVTITITDVLGRNIKTIQGNYFAGYNEIQIDLKNEGIGMFICKMDTPTHSASIKMKKVR